MCVDVPECQRRNICDQDEATGGCIERWGNYECPCDERGVHPPRSDGSVDLAVCIESVECDDNPPPCSTRRQEWEPRIGTVYQGLRVAHNPYTGECSNRSGFFVRLWKQCHCNPGYTNEISSFNRLECGNIAECNGNPCTRDELHTGQCKEMWGSYECVCQTGTKHPESGGFENRTRWNVCEPEVTCGSGICTKQKQDFEAQVTAGTADHNAYTGECTDTRLGARCTCSPGFKNKTGLEQHICEDIKECAAADVCPVLGVYTGECVERVGSYECKCHATQGKHPSTGAFNGGTDYTKCEREVDIGS